MISEGYSYEILLGEESLKFIFSKVTKSRLMGSIGMHMQWVSEEKQLDQFFLLDAEGDGIADYLGLWDAEKEQIQKERQRLMGGLGSGIVKLTRKESFNLLYEFGKLNIRNNRALPEPISEYGSFLKRDVSVSQEELLSKISEKIADETEFINYLTMRFVARDIPMLRYFSYYDEESFDFFTDEESTLLKNSVTKIREDTYSAIAVIEGKDGYYRLKLGFRILFEGRFYFRSLMGSKRELLEASEVLPIIQRNERLAIFRCEKRDVLQQLMKEIPSLFRVPFEHCVLFTEFKKDNAHVKNPEYRISDDLAGVYLLKEKELIFVALEDAMFERGLGILGRIDGLILEEELLTFTPILYDYARSDFDNIYDYMKSR